MTKYLSRILTQKEIDIFIEYLKNPGLADPPNPESMMKKDGIDQYLKHKDILATISLVNVIGYASIELRDLISLHSNKKPVTIVEESIEEISDTTQAAMILKQFTLGK